MSEDVSEQKSLDEIVDGYSENGSRDQPADDGTDHGSDEDESDRSIGALPTDWDIKQLSDICKINSDGFSENDWGEETFEYISLSNVSEGKILKSETTRIDEAPSRAQRMVKTGDVLVGTVRPKQVSHGLVTEDHAGKICSSGFGVLRTGSDLNGYYLLQEVLSHRFFRQMEAYVAGSGYPAVKIGDLKKHRIGVPPISEQQKIASVLHNVDKAIEKTEKIISQTKRVKKGVVQDAFQYGLKPDNTFRSEEEIQETYLGNIPEEWELHQISEICSEVVDCPHSTPDYEEDTSTGILVARTSEIEEGRFNVEEAPRVTEDEYIDRISRLEPEPGDIIFTREAPIGEAFKTPEGMKICLGQRVMILRPDQNTLLSDYLLELIYSDMMQSWFERSARGTTSTHMNVGDVEELEIPLPDIDEQRRITSVLNNYREKIENEMQFQDRLKHLKNGLMQDLLTGEVRTVDRDINILPEVENHG